MNVLFTQFSQNYLSYRNVISLTTARLLTFFKIQTNQKVFEENSLLNILKVKSTERFRVYTCTCSKCCRKNVNMLAPIFFFKFPSATNIDLEFYKKIKSQLTIKLYKNVLKYFKFCNYSIHFLN